MTNPEARPDTHLIQEFHAAKTPTELMEFMDRYISYGIRVDDKVYVDGDDFQQAVWNHWRTRNASEIIKDGYDMCFGQTELEREWFISKNIPCDTIFMSYQDNNIGLQLFQHSYVVYKQNDIYCVFEHADAQHRGIIAFTSFDDAITTIARQHIFEDQTRNKLPDDTEIVAIFYATRYSAPKPGLDIRQFTTHMQQGEMLLDGIDSSR